MTLYRITTLLLGAMLLAAGLAYATATVSISASPVLPVDSVRPTVTLHYLNTSPTTIRVTVPANEEEMRGFAALDVTVDGQPAHYKVYDPLRDDPKYSDVKVLVPQESFDLTVDLSLIYEIPPAWQAIHVVPANMVRDVQVSPTGVLLTHP